MRLELHGAKLSNFATAGRHGTLMKVNETRQMRMGGGKVLPVGAAAALLAALCGLAGAQDGLPPAPSAVARPLVLAGGVVVPREQPGAVRLTLDDAIAIALRQNTEIALRLQQQKYVNGQVLTVGNALAPNLSVTAYTQTEEIDLAAMGFKAGTLANVKFNGKPAGPIAEIQKVNTSAAQLNLTQAVFNVPAFYLFQAARHANKATEWQTLNSRGGVVIEVSGLYLRTLADQAQVRNAEGLLKQDELVYEHAKASKDAGVGIDLDVLRARVQLQNEQQTLEQAHNAVAKDKIQLSRVMNLPAGQELDLVDPVPFAEFDAMSVEDALKVAYERRKDLRGYEAELQVATSTQKAVKFERLPTVGIGGYYGVIGITNGSYHGNFVAEGQVSVPIFEEAELRGQKEVAVAQSRALTQQIESTRETIEGQIRSSMLDVQSAHELVKVARSNVDLATEALSDATMRFTAGVEDNLPVVQAQASLGGAQTQLIPGGVPVQLREVDACTEYGCGGV